MESGLGKKKEVGEKLSRGSRMKMALYEVWLKCAGQIQSMEETGKPVFMSYK